MASIAQNMGIGPIGQPGVIIKRKFRYTIEINTKQGLIPKSYVKVSHRPQLEIDELELQFLNASTGIPGKGRWQPLNITYIDTNSSSMQPLYNWVASVYDFQTYGTGGVDLPQTERIGWDSNVLIQVWDGCGFEIERWQLYGVWPQAVDFGDLDNSSSEEMTIDLTLRYDRVKLTGSCGSPTPQGTCKGC